jgi:RNA polymerase sigma-70 factor (ECF subfamily)
VSTEAGGPQRSLPSDSELVVRLRDRDEDAFALLLDAWSGGMLRVARSIVTTNDSAAEVLQDTWVAVLNAIDRFEGQSSLKTWVFRILVNAAIRRGVKEGRTVPWSSVADDAGPTVDESRFRGPGDPYTGDWWSYPNRWPSPEQETLAREIRMEIAAALEQLPVRQRLVITMRDIEGHSSDEICSILEISSSNQRVLLHRARAFIRGRLEEHLSAAGEGAG